MASTDDTRRPRLGKGVDPLPPAATRACHPRPCVGRRLHGVGGSVSKVESPRIPFPASPSDQALQHIRYWRKPMLRSPMHGSSGPGSRAGPPSAYTQACSGIDVAETPINDLCATQRFQHTHTHTLVDGDRTHWANIKNLEICEIPPPGSFRVCGSHP